METSTEVRVNDIEKVITRALHSGVRDANSDTNSAKTNIITTTKSLKEEVYI